MFPVEKILNTKPNLHNHHRLSQFKKHFVATKNRNKIHANKISSLIFCRLDLLFVFLFQQRNFVVPKQCDDYVNKSIIDLPAIFFNYKVMGTVFLTVSKIVFHTDVVNF